MKRFRKLAIICFLICLSAGCSGITSSHNPVKHPLPPEKEQTPLKIAVQSFYCSSMTGLIQEMGWDVEAGIPLEITAYTDGVQLNQALSSSDWDIAVTGAAFIYAMVNHDALLIAHQVDGTGGNTIVARNNSPILKVRGFNPTCPDVYGDPSTVTGYEILCNTGTAAHYTLSIWLESIGVKEDSIYLLNEDFDHSFYKFMDGAGELTSLTPPHSFKNLNRLGWTKVASLEDLGAKLLEGTLCSKEAYENRRDDVIKFVQLMYRANDMMNANKQLKFDTVQSWYKRYGKNLSTAEINSEITSKPFIGSEQARAMDLNEFAMQYAKFFVNTGTLQPEQLNIVKANITGDILTEAFESK